MRACTVCHIRETADYPFPSADWNLCPHHTPSAAGLSHADRRGRSFPKGTRGVCANCDVEIITIAADYWVHVDSYGMNPGNPDNHDIAPILMGGRPVVKG